jgi:cytochrome c-type biogenesis protein
LAAVAIKPFLGFMTRFRKHLGTVEKIMGALLVLTGILFITGSMNWFGNWLLETFPGLSTLEMLFVPDDLPMEIMKKAAEAG